MIPKEPKLVYQDRSGSVRVVVYEGKMVGPNANYHIGYIRDDCSPMFEPEDIADAQLLDEKLMTEVMQYHLHRLGPWRKF